MEQQANYIRRIEIHGLWERFNIGWDLRPDVNILSGINGVGKTTILNRSVGYLEELSGEMKSDEKNGVRLFFDNPQATYIPYDVIRSYDRPLIMGDFTARMADKNVKSELDWQLYLLQRRYLDYQVNIGNKMIEMLSDNDEKVRVKAATLSIAKRRFQDMIDELFSYTRKKIDRKRNDIAFYQDGELLFPYKLSSGEKQMLVILLTVLVQDNSHCVLFMDEPLSNLDAKLRVEMQVEIKRIQKELGITTIIVTHDHEEAVSLADRVIVMNAGHILQIGKPQEVFDRPASPFIADFMGFSTFLHGIAAGAEGDMRLIRCGAHTLQVPAEAAQELTEGDACILAIRSENIRTAEQEGVNTVRGTVKSATYKGHTTRLEVSGCFEEMVYPAIHEYADVQEGSEVLLHFPAQHFCVYKDIK